MYNYLIESLWPLVTNAVDLGANLARWRKFWSVDADFSGVVTITRVPVAGSDAVNKTYADSVGGGITAEEVDGSPTYAATTTLRFDSADGFVLTQPGAGIARVDLAAVPVTLLAGSFTDLGTTLTGNVAVVDGGTNLSSYAIGDILYASAATTIASLVDVATGNAVISGGIGVAPLYGKIGLTTHISGVLDEANGGVGSDNSATAQGNIFYFSGAGVVATLAPGTSRYQLKTQGAAANPIWGEGGAGHQIIGLVGNNNAGTPNTQYDLDADVVILHEPASGDTIANRNPGSLTNNISTAGPTAGGRDAAGAFSASSWVHFYWIWNGTTLSTVSSATAPTGAAGPVMPSGYTHWAYAGAVRYNATPLLINTRMRGAWATYGEVISALSAGVATVETAIDLTTLIPPNALMLGLLGQFAVSTGANGTGRVSTNIRHTTALTYTQLAVYKNAATDENEDTQWLVIPNVAQNLFYLVTEVGDGTDVSALTIYILGYSMPNGGE